MSGLRVNVREPRRAMLFRDWSLVSLFFSLNSLGLRLAMSNDIIDVRSLKNLVFRLPSGHPLRIVLMLEDNWLSPDRFLVKVGMWLKLLELETA